MSAISNRTPLLDTIKSPADLKGLSTDQLKQLAEELRADTIEAVSGVGGHFGASLGVVELSVVLHHVFNTPDDILIWDVSHQCYPHKILTGRREGVRKIRQAGDPPASPAARRASTTPSVPPIARPRFRRAWASPSAPR